MTTLKTPNHFLTRAKLGAAAITAAAVFIFIHIHLYNPHEQQSSDGLENLAGAYNLALYNTYSTYTADQKPHPTAAREPLFPFLLGLIIKAKNALNPPDKDLRKQPIETIYKLSIEPLETQNHLKAFNIALLFTTILVASAFVY